ncbi:MAG: hypothetical protein QM767_15995 [Anaeromyxobacter sp.]
MADPSFYLRSPEARPEMGSGAVLPGVSRTYDLAKGVRMGSNFPPTVVFEIAKRSGDVLTDFLPNTNRVIMASERVAEFLRAELPASDEIEFLPFGLKNKKGRLVQTPRYCLVNPLRKVECLDRKRSKYAAADTGELVMMDELHLAEDRIPPDTKLFRLAELPTCILYRADLVEKIRAAGFTGFTVAAPGDNLTL